MHLSYNLFLFLITLLGGCVSFWIKNVDEKRTNYLLAFSGSFLLSITLLHLLPETFEETGHHAGLLILAGFFLQMLIQRMTHGLEHGHVHIHIDNNHTHQHTIPFNSIFLGLSLHAFMEGLPLGFNYRMEGTEPSLYLAIATHKLPEAMLITSLAINIKGKKNALIALLFFSLITPFGSILAGVFGRKYYAVSEVVTWLIPLVAGAFIHIATTIFFESGTKQHLLTRSKLIAILLGVGLGLATLLFE